MANVNVNFLARTPVQFHAPRFGPGLNVMVQPPEVTVPVVSNVTPPSGVAIDKTAAIGFDVTDLGGNLKRANVYAYFPSLQRFEVVYFCGAISGAWGSRTAGFGPGYGGTRAAITNGYRFSDVVRTGGWPAPPVIVTDPIDSAGNEAT